VSGQVMNSTQDDVHIWKQLHTHFCSSSGLQIVLTWRFIMYGIRCKWIQLMCTRAHAHVVVVIFVVEFACNIHIFQTSLMCKNFETVSAKI